MAYYNVAGQPKLGRIWLPERTVILPDGTRRHQFHEGMVVASVVREDELIWACIAGNERVDRGASIQHNRMWGSGTTANGLINAIAVAKQTFTVAKGDLSLGSGSAGVTANEFTDSGLTRANGAADSVGAPTVPDALNTTSAGTIVRTFTVTAPGGTVFGVGLFDRGTANPTPPVVAGSNLYAESGPNTSPAFVQAVVVANDTLAVTWTVTF